MNNLTKEQISELYDIAKTAAIIYHEYMSDYISYKELAEQDLKKRILKGFLGFSDDLIDKVRPYGPKDPEVIEHLNKLENNNG